MKFLRESAILKSNKFKERRSVVGSFNNFGQSQYRQVMLTAHKEMEYCVSMFNRNSLANAGVKTMKDFIKGGEIRVKSLDENTRKQAQKYLEDLNIDIWLDELIENTIKTGNGYLEFDYSDNNEDVVKKVYPIPDSSRIYINCDEYGNPVPIKKLINENGEMVYREVLNTDEYYIQKIDPQYKTYNAKYYSLKYQFGSMFSQFQIYGIPIPMKNVLHIKLGIGDIGVYGRSDLASTILDFETLEQIERSIAIIAKHKAVPRDIISYGSDENPATDDELNDFIIYLESLEKDQSAIINKPFKRETISYAGQDINLDYMIKHIKNKLTAGLAPEFALGMSSNSNKNTSQLTLLSYILSIYSKRKLILKPIEDKILKPFLQAMGLQDAWLEFGELDFETKSEKTNRIGSMWTQNVLTLNETRYQLGFPILEHGNVFFSQWQQELITSDPTNNGDDGDSLKNIIEDDSDEKQRMKGSPGANVKEPTQDLPNNDSTDKVFNHRDAPNKKTIQKGRPLNTISKPNPRLIKKEKSQYSEMMDDIKMLEKTLNITIDIDEDDYPKSKDITFKTLMDKFAYVFDEPMSTELYYKNNGDTFTISFNSTKGVMINCTFTKEDVLKFYGRTEQLSYEQQEEFVNAWISQHIQKAIEVK
ncbi:MAG: phage portal protein [Candidatus Moranbacteria bacterium]|nr:phage portal protein [Candidatus Moranbacteria bacterium]